MQTVHVCCDDEFHRSTPNLRIMEEIFSLHNPYLAGKTLLVVRDAPVYSEDILPETGKSSACWDMVRASECWSFTPYRDMVRNAILKWLPLLSLLRSPLSGIRLHLETERYMTPPDGATISSVRPIACSSIPDHQGKVSKGGLVVSGPGETPELR